MPVACGPDAAAETQMLVVPPVGVETVWIGGRRPGRAPAEQRLDGFFAYPKLLTYPAGTARTEWISSPSDYYGKPAYDPNNEPDLLALYMYLWAGAPARTATVVRAAMTLPRPSSGSHSAAEFSTAGQPATLRDQAVCGRGLIRNGRNRPHPL
jgi:hypothetical protein